MKISFNWLKQYIPTNLDAAEMSEILTSIGLEVEGTELFESVKGSLEGVVTGEVVSCTRHPGADNLSLARVDTGSGRMLQIVCGAPNIAAGQKVVVALAGATLYNGSQRVTIKKTKIRGELSEGMICAEDELGLGDSHEGILVLDNETEPGTPAGEYFNVEHDTVLEIGLTPNRIDAASHFGVARDLAAWIGQSGEVELLHPDVSDFKPDNNDYPVEIIIRDPQSCIRYSGLTISGVKVAPSPAWLKNRLRAIGLKPINNVVDITNYVLHETGQPLHAFNADKIVGKKVIIGNLPAGTRFTTLDEQIRELSSEDLMICNETEGMCIAGVFGGIGSGVNHATTNIFLESACFDPVSIRKTARRHGLNTDASFRFERGTDPTATVYTLKRTAMLIRRIAGGSISSDVGDVYPREIKPVELDLDYSYVNRLIGETIPAERIQRILSLLDFKITKITDLGIHVEVPLYRVDVTRPADVVEEILRIYGYNTIAVPDSVHSVLSWSEKPDKEKYTHAVADMLSGMGFNEIISNSLTKSLYYKDMESFPEKNLIRLLNPLSTDLDSMRQSLLFGGLEAVLYNSNRKNPDLKLYEFGNIYKYTGTEGELTDLAGYNESRHLALFISGAFNNNVWNSKGRASDFYDIKAYVSRILERTGLDLDISEYEEIQDDIYLYGVRLISGGQIIAEYGSVHPAIAGKAGLKNEVFHADIRWDDLLRMVAHKNTVFSELPRYPEVRRDLAMELNREIKFQTIRKIAFKTEKKLLKRINLFDVYQGEKIAEGKKSYAISFILQDIEGTLTDSQIDAVMEKIAGAFEKETGARIRR
jgi:phenylalanyl-tRNA synthetase beta chain